MAKKKTEKKTATTFIPNLPRETEAVVQLGNAIDRHDIELEGIRCRIDRIVEAHEKCKSLRNL